MNDSKEPAHMIDKKMSEMLASVDPARPSSLSAAHSRLLGWLRVWEHEILLISTCNPNHFSLETPEKWLLNETMSLVSWVSEDPFAFSICFSFFHWHERQRNAQKEDCFPGARRHLPNEYHKVLAEQGTLLASALPWAQAITIFQMQLTADQGAHSCVYALGH